MGKAAHGRGRTGLALLVERFAYNVDLGNGAKPATASRKSTKVKAMAATTENQPKEATTRDRVDVREYALAHVWLAEAQPNRRCP